MIKLESGNIAALHLGGQKIARAYLGDALVFDGVPAPAIYTITASIDPEGGGTVTGAGQYREGETVTLKAVPGDGYQFSGWQENGQTVSEEAEYTFVAAGDRTLVAAFKIVTPSRLPNGYTEVEYIKSDSKCGINTGVTFDLMLDKFELDLKPGAYVSGSEFILGNTSSSSPRSRLYRMSSTSVTRLWGKANGPTSTSVSVANRRLTISISGGGLKVGTTTLTTITASMTTAGAICLLSGDSSSVSIQAEIYSCKIHKGNVLSRDFVPCINPSGTVGFYDLVENKFYANTQTGIFTAGPEI